MEEEYKYYVYALLDPRKPWNYKYGDYTFKYLPFYIGKGKGGRCKEHINEAYSKSKGNYNPHIIIDGKLYLSIKDASEQTGMSKSGIKYNLKLNKPGYSYIKKGNHTYGNKY